MPTSRWRVPTIVLALLLAGCAGAPEDPAGGLGIGADFREGRGAIQGQVVSDEYFPLANATVGILEVATQTLTDANGRFVLRDLAAGTYSVQVIAFGFESKQVRITVQSELSAQVDFVLAPLPTDEPYVEVVPFSGLVRSITWRIGSSCQTIVQPPLGTCLGYQPSSLILYYETLPFWGTMVGELVWQPNSAVFHQRAYMYVTFPNVTDFSGVPDFESPGHFETGGPSPQALRIERQTVLDRGHPEESHFGRTRFRALNNFDDVNASGLAGVSLMLDQPMDMYWSFFYRQTAPDSYTALPDE